MVRPSVPGRGGIDATDLGGDWYPSRYLARAKDVIPELLTHETPGDPWNRMDRSVLSACSPDEELIIVVWDES